MGDHDPGAQRADLFGKFFWRFINVDQHMAGAKCGQLIQFGGFRAADNGDGIDQAFGLDTKGGASNHLRLQIQGEQQLGQAGHQGYDARRTIHWSMLVANRINQHVALIPIIMLAFHPTKWMMITSKFRSGEGMTDDLLERKEGRVAILTMNRPDRLNAMSGAMLDAMLEALGRLGSDPETGCVILTGAGRGFCAGGDVKAMAEGTEFPDATMEGKAQQLRAKMETSRLLHEMPKPTIAMVRGPVAGAGLSLALACDMRVASESMKMTSAFANVGYSGDFGGSYFLTRLVGTAKARELYYTADRVEAADALALGILNRVVADDELEAETMALAEKMANGPSIALGYMKRNMNAAETGSLRDCLDLEAWHHTRTGMTEDHKEAAQAFVDKRTPVFKGQ